MTADVIEFPKTRCVSRAAPNERLVSHLERALAMAQAGEMVGFYAVAISAGGDVSSFFDEPPGGAPFKALGAVDWLKSRIRTAHDL